MTEDGDTRWGRIRELYFDALELPREKRDAFLANTAGNDADLIREVTEMLLASGEERALKVERKLVTDSPDDRGANVDRTGERIGQYRLARILGRGGMGDVYLGERDDDQFDQTVALKLLATGRSTAEAEARFHTERQILARLQHPNIAQLLDGGVTEHGQPYFVMQAINGVPVTRYCDAKQLSIRDRLALFRVICTAVQYAHRNLVVHRDLKPSNILVTERGDVKLLDFGIAKLLEPDMLGISDGLTRTGDLLMTPEYAAPEQITGDPVTAATDIYGLGLLLYEMLTGHTPQDRRAKSRSDLERIVLSEELTPPSRAIFRVSEKRLPDGDSESVTPETVASARSVRPGELGRLLRGDLETILMKALRVEPERRYESAGQLSEDIARYMNDLPVLARPDRIGYRMSKFVRRNRVGVAAVGIVVLCLAFSTVITSMQANRASRERDRAERVAGLLVDLFESTNPILDPAGDTLRVRAFLRESESRVLKELEGQPETAAQMKHVLGRIYSARGNFERSRGLLREALEDQRLRTGRESEETAAVLSDLGTAEAALTGPEAEALLRESLELQQRVHGRRHEAVAQAMQDLATVVEDPDECVALIHGSLKMRRAMDPPNPEGVAASLNQLAIYHFQRQEAAEAAKYFAETLEIIRQKRGENHPYVLVVMQNLASCYSQSGDLGRAEDMLRKVERGQREILGPEAPQRANTLNGLCVIAASRGDYTAAKDLLDEAIRIYEHAYGPHHMKVANAIRNLAWIWIFEGEHEKSLPYFDRAIESQAGFDGTESISTLHIRGQRASAMLSVRPAPAIRDSLERILESISLKSPGDSRELADTEVALGRVLLETGEIQRAETLFRSALAFREPRLGKEHGWTAEAEAGIALCLAMFGRPDEAATMIETAAERYSSFGLADPAWQAKIEEVRQRIRGR